MARWSVRPAWEAIRARQWRRLWLGPVAAALIGICAFLQALFHPAALTYSAATAWPQAWWRIPLTVIAPALHLPCGGAALQAVVVFCCVQPLLGLGRTLAVALTGHVLATLAMRLLVDLASGVVPGIWRHELDTGPSVAVPCAAVAGFTVCRATAGCVVIAVGVAAEVIALHAPAGVEHLLGLMVGLAAGLIWRRSFRQAQRAAHPAGRVALGRPRGRRATSSSSFQRLFP